jgi:hypothetical protein
MPDDMTYDKRKSRVREEIDANLKRVYEQVVNEEIPDRLKELLDKLRKSEGNK